jgi:hypothetical protein
LARGEVAEEEAKEEEQGDRRRRRGREQGSREVEGIRRCNEEEAKKLRR